MTAFLEPGISRYDFCAVVLSAFGFGLYLVRESFCCGMSKVGCTEPLLTVVTTAGERCGRSTKNLG
jgi:hypothetical protein